MGRANHGSLGNISKPVQMSQRNHLFHRRFPDSGITARLHSQVFLKCQVIRGKDMEIALCGTLRVHASQQISDKQFS